MRGVTRLELAIRRPGQHDVADLQARLAFGEGEQRPADADLDVVRMRADREQGQRAAPSGALRRKGSTTLSPGP